MEKKCCNCACWVRDGADGICRAHAPSSAVVPEADRYTLVWPRTRDADFCVCDFVPYMEVA